jgi:hypothetical protein
MRRCWYASSCRIWYQQKWGLSEWFPMRSKTIHVPGGTCFIFYFKLSSTHVCRQGSPYCPQNLRYAVPLPPAFELHTEHPSTPIYNAQSNLCVYYTNPSLYACLYVTTISSL